MFLVRSIAFTLGSISIKKLVHRYSTQRIYIANGLLIALSLLCCTFSLHPINLTVMLFVSALCIMSSNILTASLTIKLFKDSNPEFYMLIRGIAFGAGAFVAPLMTMAFELQTYTVLALL
jgi:MFS family permease